MDQSSTKKRRESRAPKISKEKKLEAVEKACNLLRDSDGKIRNTLMQVAAKATQILKEENVQAQTGTIYNFLITDLSDEWRKEQGLVLRSEVRERKKSGDPPEKIPVKTDKEVNAQAREIYQRAITILRNADKPVTAETISKIVGKPKWWVASYLEANPEIIGTS